MIKIYEAVGQDIGLENGPARLGVFTGERDDIIEWLDVLFPGFKESLLKTNGSCLNIIEPQLIGKEMVQELKEATRLAREADMRLKALLGNDYATRFRRKG